MTGRDFVITLLICFAPAAAIAAGAIAYMVWHDQ